MLSNENQDTMSLDPEPSFILTEQGFSNSHVVHSVEQSGFIGSGVLKPRLVYRLVNGQSLEIHRVRWGSEQSSVIQDTLNIRQLVASLPVSTESESQAADYKDFIIKTVVVHEGTEKGPWMTLVLQNRITTRAFIVFYQPLRRVVHVAQHEAITGSVQSARFTSIPDDGYQFILFGMEDGRLLVNRILLGQLPRLMSPKFLIEVTPLSVIRTLCVWAPGGRDPIVFVGGDQKERLLSYTLNAQSGLIASGSLDLVSPTGWMQCLPLQNTCLCVGSTEAADVKLFQVRETNPSMTLHLLETLRSQASENHAVSCSVVGFQKRSNESCRIALLFNSEQPAEIRPELLVYDYVEGKQSRLVHSAVLPSRTSTIQSICVCNDKMYLLSKESMLRIDFKLNQSVKNQVPLLPPTLSVRDILTWIPPTMSYTKASIQAIEETRKRFEGELFMDRLLQCLNIDSSLYPPVNRSSLEGLVAQIIDNPDFDDIQKHCLMYYLLKDGANAEEKQLAYARYYCMPIHFQILIDGYWSMDHCQYQDAVYFFSQPLVEADWPDKIFHTLYREHSFKEAYYFLTVVKPKFTEVEDIQLQLDLYIRIDFTEALLFQRNAQALLPNETNLLLQVLNRLLSQSAPSAHLKKLVTFPWTESEEETIIRYALTLCTPLSLEFLFFFLIQRHYRAEALELTLQLQDKMPSGRYTVLKPVISLLQSTVSQAEKEIAQSLKDWKNVGKYEVNEETDLPLIPIKGDTDMARLSLSHASKVVVERHRQVYKPQELPVLKETNKANRQIAPTAKPLESTSHLISKPQNHKITIVEKELAIDLESKPVDGEVKSDGELLRQLEQPAKVTLQPMVSESASQAVKSLVPLSKSFSSQPARPISKPDNGSMSLRARPYQAPPMEVSPFSPPRRRTQRVASSAHSATSADKTVEESTQPQTSVQTKTKSPHKSSRRKSPVRFLDQHSSNTTEPVETHVDAQVRRSSPRKSVSPKKNENELADKTPIVEVVSRTKRKELLTPANEEEALNSSRPDSVELYPSLKPLQQDPAELYPKLKQSKEEEWTNLEERISASMPNPSPSRLSESDLSFYDSSMNFKSPSNKSSYPPTRPASASPGRSTARQDEISGGGFSSWLSRPLDTITSLLTTPWKRSERRSAPPESTEEVSSPHKPLVRQRSRNTTKDGSKKVKISNSPTRSPRVKRSPSKTEVEEEQSQTSTRRTSPRRSLVKAKAEEAKETKQAEQETKEMKLEIANEQKEALDGEGTLSKRKAVMIKPAPMSELTSAKRTKPVQSKSLDIVQQQESVVDSPRTRLRRTKAHSVDPTYRPVVEEEAESPVSTASRTYEMRNRSRQSTTSGPSTPATKALASVTANEDLRKDLLATPQDQTGLPEDGRRAATSKKTTLPQRRVLTRSMVKPKR